MAEKEAVVDWGSLFWLTTKKKKLVVKLNQPARITHLRVSEITTEIENFAPTCWET